MTSSRLGWLEFSGAVLTGGPQGRVPLSPPGPGGGVVLVTWSRWRGRGSALGTWLPRRWWGLVPWDLGRCQLSSQEVTSKSGSQIPGSLACSQAGGQSWLQPHSSTKNENPYVPTHKGTLEPPTEPSHKPQEALSPTEL